MLATQSRAAVAAEQLAPTGETAKLHDTSGNSAMTLQAKACETEKWWLAG